MDDSTNQKEKTKLNTEANTNLSKAAKNNNDSQAAKTNKKEKKNKSNEKSKLESLEAEVIEDSNCSSSNSNNVSKKRV